MITDFLPPTQAEECRNTAEILRDLAAQLRFADTHDLLINLADNLDGWAIRFERQDATQPLEVRRQQEVVELDRIEQIAQRAQFPRYRRVQGSSVSAGISQR